MGDSFCANPACKNRVLVGSKKFVKGRNCEVVCEDEECKEWLAKIKHRVKKPVKKREQKSFTEFIRVSRMRIKCLQEMPGKKFEEVVSRILGGG